MNEGAPALETQQHIRKGILKIVERFYYVSEQEEQKLDIFVSAVVSAFETYHRKIQSVMIWYALYQLLLLILQRKFALCGRGNVLVVTTVPVLFAGTWSVYL